MVPKIKRFREWLIEEIPQSARVTEARQAAAITGGPPVASP